jgi:hypothetical protein
MSLGLAAGIGAFLLLAVLLWGWMQTRKRDDQIDPATPADDPSKGMGPKGPRAS